MHFPLLHRAFYNRGKAFYFRQMTRPPLALPPSGLPFLPMLCSPGAGLPRFAPAAFSPDGLWPVVPSSPLAVWAGCPSLLRSVRL